MKQHSIYNSFYFPQISGDILASVTSTTTRRPKLDHCEFPNRLCDNSTCLTPSDLCNGKADCLDGSDEGPICGNLTFKCPLLTCRMRYRKSNNQP